LLYLFSHVICYVVEVIFIVLRSSNQVGVRIKVDEEWYLLGGRVCVYWKKGAASKLKEVVKMKCKNVRTWRLSFS